jgi:hypothetical protein
LVASAKLLDEACKTEKNADVLKRLLLVRRVRVDDEEAAGVAEKEFHRSRWWAYKYHKGGLSTLHQKKRKESSKKDEGDNLEHT